MNKVIELKNLNVSFKSKRSMVNIIRGVDIDLYEGQIVGLVGESGSGKSVTSKSLLNVNTDAFTTIDSLDIIGEKYEAFKDVNWKDIRGKKISYVPQNPHTSLNPSRKIYKQIIDVMEESNDEIKELLKNLKEDFKNELEELKAVKAGELNRIVDSYERNSIELNAKIKDDKIKISFKKKIIKELNDKEHSKAEKELKEMETALTKLISEKNETLKNLKTEIATKKKENSELIKEKQVHFKEVVIKEGYLGKIREIFDIFHIKDIDRILNAYPHELSGGLKQRVIIAMSVLTGAKIIIADEPTTALDATVQSSVLNLMQETVKKLNISMIFISHNIGVIAKLCDYIYVMYAGRVVEKASKTDLFTDPVHPYTWALISSIPEGADKNHTKLYTIPGNPVDMTNLPQGDPFASRNEYAIALDFKQEPPLFEYKKGHWAATWMLHPSYPKTGKPEELVRRLTEFAKTLKK